ncbi:MAG: DUF1512 family protein [Candidatus Heimdallarchaeota archaeon]
MMLYQFWGGNSWGNIIWFILIIFLMLFYPRIMISQAVWRLEQSAIFIERLTINAKRIVIRKVSKKPTKELKEAIGNFLEFFVIQPVSLDPFGIVKKIEHVLNLQEKKFKYFAKRIAPKLDPEQRSNLIMGLSGAISLNQVSKVVRHYVELVRKTKNLQLAIVVQMQLPLIERISKALYKGTEALTNGWPIGDSVGPLVGAHLIGDSKVKEVEEDTLVARKKIKGKTVFIVKAKGPGGRLGKLGKTVERLVKKYKISKIITIDAATKLEGETTGSVAEGIGVAIGGIGVDRSYIEDISTKKEIPLDSYVIKMGQEEAIQPMKKEILMAVPKVIKRVEENIKETKGNIIVVGVGNTVGVGNNKKDAEKAEKLVNDVLKILKRRKEVFKERKGVIDWLTGW